MILIQADPDALWLQLYEDDTRGELIFTINMSSTDKFCKLTVISDDFLYDLYDHVLESREAVLNPILVIPALWILICFFIPQPLSPYAGQKLTLWKNIFPLPM